MRGREVGVARRWLVVGCLCLLSVGYLLQIFSPLRINTDSYRLLSMAVSAYQGQGYLVDGHTDQYPLAYPFVVKTLLQTDMASSMVIVILNLLCLFVGILAFYASIRTWHGSVRAMLPLAFVLSSWVMVKHVTLPITELLYFGLSLLSLFFVMVFLYKDGHRKWWFLAIASVISYFALLTRTAGITLFPVLMLTAVLHKDNTPYIARFFTLRRCILAVVYTTAILFCVWLLLHRTSWYALQFTRPDSYWQAMLALLGRGTLAEFFFQNINYRILEFGEVFTNFPSNKAPQFLPVVYLVGAVSWCVVLFGVWLLLRTKSYLPFVLYFLTYSALMLMWPYYDPRFWLPLLPVLAFLFLTGSDSFVCRMPATQYALRCYMLGFVFLGFVALYFSSKISLSGTEFSELYGDGTGRMTYRLAFKNGKSVDMQKIDEGQLQLLRIFEPLAATN